MPKIRAWPVIAAVLLVASAALGLVLTGTDLLSSRDAAVSENLHSLDSGWIHGVAATVSTALSAPAGLVIVVVWGAALVLRGRRPAALTTVLTVVVGWGAAMLIKYLLDRPRPPFEAADGPSYPSGHTALAVGLVFAAFFLVRRADVRDTVVTVGVLAVVGVMFCRVIVGAHFLTDTVGAVLAASGAIVLLSGVWNRAAPALSDRFPVLAGPAGHRQEPPHTGEDPAASGTVRAYPPADPLAPDPGASRDAPSTPAPAAAPRERHAHDADGDSMPV